MTPEEWLAGFESTVADVRRKAAEFEQNLEQAGATEVSKDGSLRVTVAPNGALTGLEIGDAAARRPGGELAAQIMALARKAQRSAAVRVAEAFAPLAGEDSEALRMVTSYVPPEEPEEPEAPSVGRRIVVGSEEPVEESPPRPAPRPKRSRPAEDDEDFSERDTFLRRKKP
ncbi:YbaB/EbfC DNA-binding family protein [Herbihabitans rhizosphaerae]|uniref:YbaB/EbfC DNA-binding family protein n=1 Tax=Herbihabitans rhizosphaerae TaxID=1872711 RepID=A0A4Q7L6W6_9PSEU|nr:YbaB/EbfC family nucleoid-associated protein [Herbihabitans rhizosphaerae]RZS44610.1 YbaB/EbfC DNA-binding family protein [Herbihabitans rhizosphaerae]